MKRSHLEHVLRAAGAIASVTDLIVVGSQAILGWSEPAPSTLLVSIEVDLYPRDVPERSDLIDGSIGERADPDQFLGGVAYTALEDDGITIDPSLLSE